MEPLELLDIKLTSIEDTSDSELVDLPEVRAEVLAAKKLINETHYVIRVIDNSTGKPAHILRRYEDFVELDLLLRGVVSNRSTVVSYLLPLPDKSQSGDATEEKQGSFNESLKDKLQLYLDAILLQVPALGEVPAVKDFLTAAITSKTRKEWDAPDMQPEVVRMVTEEMDGHELKGPITENNAAMIMMLHLRTVLRKMDDETIAHNVPRTEQEVENDVFASNVQVCLVGLVNKKYHNTKVCTVISYSSVEREYRVLMPDGKTKRVKGVNLRRVHAVDMATKSVSMKFLEEEGQHDYKDSAVRGWARLVLHQA